MTAARGSGARLAALAVAQVVSWGVLYYGVLVAAPAISADTGWDDELIFVAVTAGLLVSALSSIPIGRWLDRHPRRVMVSGAMMGTLAMSVAALSPTIWIFAAAWILCGIAQSGVLYQAAFTVITHRYRAARRAPLTLVTLAGGLASTIFAPLTGWLILELGWRTAFFVLAAILAVTALPTYALTIERRWTHVTGQPAAGGAASRVLRSVRFWALTIAFALMSFSLYAVTLSAVPASVEKGLDLQAAAWVLGLIGAGQVLGRLVYLVVPHTAAPWIAPACVGLLGAAALVLFAVASSPTGVFAAAIVAGAIRGALTLVQASAVADRWGAATYGRLNGVLAAPVIALTAFAPAAAAILAATAGTYTLVALTMAVVCAMGGAMAIRR
ncbi:MFS transporter [Microbacterium immunditiarum]|uniref:MFS family permease n=1 Tax=Microbacterium immunditiarum TaxID=337480 RepID=A0A7Y9GMX9_9MICO|nr:MFS transporter [Microbacterium immunditiarum]NYE19442.1 MFS family permease [Microbacterium immunditiarum]